MFVKLSVSVHGSEWRVLCVLLILCCGLSTLKSTTIQDPELLEVYFLPLIPPLAMAWLWYVALRVWEARHIDHACCFPISQQRLLPHALDVRDAALVVTTFMALSASTFSLAAIIEFQAFAAFLPCLLYGALLAFIVTGGHGVVHNPKARSFLRQTLCRVFLPVQACRPSLRPSVRPPPPLSLSPHS
mmetsp:Transcript_17837/g.42802  ORF Transcript_17837/g.42802 Transcript_17837/m.42802 type:complete len:187 (-) Transcript_17837:272-832(-)